jgi:glycosyltransferase involved in cell wall biosynthesis
MKRRIKVLRIITRLSVGGSSVHSILLTAHLDKEAFDSLLVKGSEGADEGDLQDLLGRKEIDPVFIPELKREISFKDDLTVFRKLYRLMRQFRPDIVHTHSAKSGVLGRLAAKLAGVPVIVHTFHGHLFRGYFGPVKSKLVVYAERLLALLSTRIVAVTQSQKDELAAYRIAPRRKLVNIPLGLELGLLQNLEGEKGKLRSELGLDEEDLLVGSIARLVPVKGHSFLFRAAQRVITALPRARFLIIGDGELRRELEKLARQLGIRENVIFCGFRRDLPRIYADLDLLALTSLNEGLPVAVIEAMASQTPVVAYRVGGVEDLVENNVTGISLPFGEIDRLAESIMHLLKNPQERRRMGQNARRKVYPRLDYARLVKDYADFYPQLLGNENRVGQGWESGKSKKER